MKTLLYLLMIGFCAACSQQAGYSKDPHETVRSPGAFPHVLRKIKTTAYCGLEDGVHRNAVGGRLDSGKSYSASADWSRYPAGTVFRVLENGRTYTIDDYGPALVGTDKIDLHVSSLSEMRKWGVRRVQIEILKKGDPAKSLKILRPRAKHEYVRRMVRDLEKKVR